MANIKVRKELYIEAPDKNMSDTRAQFYTEPYGLRRVEKRDLQGESDFANESYERFSDDNGKTWSDWKDVYGTSFEQKANGDEINWNDGCEFYNPVHEHFVSLGMQRIFMGNHKDAYRAHWDKGENSFIDHVFVSIRKQNSEQKKNFLVKYEPGIDFQPEDWRNQEYIDKNVAYFGISMDIQENGDILFPIAASLNSCCRILGIDPDNTFPPYYYRLCKGLIIVNGKWNEIEDKYILSFSKPIIISDLKSSRGVGEPIAIKLNSGRIVAVFRGSNAISNSWNIRIEEGAPAHKWYCYSDDNGSTFTEPIPWHFDDREVFYSSATYSQFVRSIKNGKLYWIGNITGHEAYGDYPRFPLNIAEVDEKIGLLKKETLTVIDTHDPEKDSDKVQLSNFTIIQDRVTKQIEVYLAKFGQREGFTWWADCYRYFIELCD